MATSQRRLDDERARRASRRALLTGTTGFSARTVVTCFLLARDLPALLHQPHELVAVAAFVFSR